MSKPIYYRRQFAWDAKAHLLGKIRNKSMPFVEVLQSMLNVEYTHDETNPVENEV